MNGSANPARKAPPVPMLVYADVSAIKGYQVSGQHGGLNNYEALTFSTDHMLLMCVVSMPIYYEAVDNHSVMYM